MVEKQQCLAVPRILTQTLEKSLAQMVSGGEGQGEVKAKPMISGVLQQIII